MDSSLKHPQRGGPDERRRRRREERRRQVRRRRASALAVALAVVAASVLAVAVLGGPDAGGATRGPGEGKPTAVAAKAPVAKPTPAGPPIEIAAVGDMTFGRQGDAPPGGAESLLGGVAALLAASDFTTGNLETTLGSSGASGCRAASTDCFSFQASSDTAGALRRAGFDAVSVGNNHANDYGASGQARTSAALRDARLPFTGRPGQITYVRVQGIRIALLGFAPYPFASNLLEIPAAAALVRRAARQAQLVVVLMHVGAEGKDAQHVRPGTETFLGENRGDPIAFAHAVVDAGADLVLGSGPHVLRGLEWYRGRLIAHSLGNFSGYRTLNTSGISGAGAILRVTLAPDGTFAAGTLVPLRLDSTGTPSADPTRAALPIVAKLGRADFGKAGARVDARGAIAPPG